MVLRSPLASKQMRCKGMTQGMWGRRGRQAERRAQLFDTLLDKARRQNPAARTAKHRFVGIDREGTLVQIAGDGGADRRDQRHQPHLSALAGDTDRLAIEIGAAQRQCFGDSKARAVAQRQNRRIAGGDPGRFFHLAGQVERLTRLHRRQGFWQGFGQFRPTNDAQRLRFDQAPRARETKRNCALPTIAGRACGRQHRRGAAPP